MHFKFYEPVSGPARRLLARPAISQACELHLFNFNRLARANANMYRVRGACALRNVDIAERFIKIMAANPRLIL